jgi:hypothetical protein
MAMQQGSIVANHINLLKENKKAKSKNELREFKFMIRQTSEVDNLIKKKKDILENKADDIVADYDAAFNQFEVILYNMYRIDSLGRIQLGRGRGHGLGPGRGRRNFTRFHDDSRFNMNTNFNINYGSRY